MKKKVILVFLLIVCIFLFFDIKSQKSANKDIDKVLNETYYDYVENPNNYIITKATIISEFEPDIGNAFNFFQTREWLVEVKLNDGTLVTTEVMRDKNDKLGDVIEIAYFNDAKEVLMPNMRATQLHYIESTGVYKTDDIFLLADIIIIVVLATIIIWLFTNGRNKKKNTALPN